MRFLAIILNLVMLGSVIWLLSENGLPKQNATAEWFLISILVFVPSLNLAVMVKNSDVESISSNPISRLYRIVNLWLAKKEDELRK